MPTIASVLHEITVRRGQPLYRYRLTGDQWDRLRCAVKQAAGDLQGRMEYAGVALLAARNLCQRHERGPWKWHDALGFDPGGQIQSIGKALEDYWERPLVVSGRGHEVLATLGREGGLPRSLLLDQDAQLGRILRGALRDKERHPTEPTAELVAEHQHLLPPGRQTPAIAEVLAELVDNILEIRSELLGYAAQVDLPDDWQARLALDFDPEHLDAVRALILGIVQTERSTPDAPPFSFELRLRGDRVERRIDPSIVSVMAMQRCFSACGSGRAAELPSYGRLFAVADDGTRAAIATLTRAGSHYRVRDKRRPNLGLTSDLTLLLDAGGQQWIWQNPPGGAAPSADEPWVFDDDGGHWLGSGSVSTAAAAVRVVTPVDWPMPESAELLGGAVAGDEPRKVWRVAQAVEVIPPGESVGFRLRPGVGAEAARWTLQGSARRLAGRGTRVWSGELCAIGESAEGHRRRETVEYAYVGQSDGWTRLHASDLALGELWVRVVRDGAVCFRRKVLRVPTDFDLTLVPQGDAAGEVTRTCPAELTPIGLGGHWVRKSPECVAFDFGAEFPSAVRLSVKLPKVRAFEVEVPAPVRQEAVLGLDRKPVRVDRPLAVDELGGIRAQVFDPLAPERQRVTLVATAGRLTRQRDVEVWLPERDAELYAELRLERPGTWALGLDELVDDLKLLLAQAGHLDAVVRLRLNVDGRSGRHDLARVRHYARQLVVLPADDEPGPRVPSYLHLDSDRAEEGVSDQVELRATPIGQPDHPGIVLPPERGGWLWPDPARQDGPWLITGTQMGFQRAVSAVRPRMIRLRGTGQPAPVADGALARAIGVDDPAERAEALAACFDEMARDSAHPDWALLDAHLKTLSWLPAVTYDVVVGLAKHPGVLAMAVVRSAFAGPNGGLSHLISGLETLPFAWWQVPSKAWCQVVQAQGRDLMDRLSPEMVSEFINRMLAQVGEHGGLFKGVERLMRECVNPVGSPSAKLGEALLPAFNAVTRRQDHDWPKLRPSADALLAELGAPLNLLEHLPRQTAPEHRDVLAAPLIAAWVARSGTRLALKPLIVLRRIRAFDPVWFDTAWSEAVVRFHTGPTSGQCTQEIDR